MKRKQPVEPVEVAGRAPLDVVIHSPGLPVSGEDPAGLSLGGSETAAVSMARALNGQGHRVAVSCNTGRPHYTDGVYYLPERQALTYLSKRDCDVFLCSRFHQILAQNVRANLIGLWHHDVAHPSNIDAVKVALSKTAFSLFVSRFQMEGYEQEIPGIAEQGRITANGVDFDAIEAVGRSHSRDRSRPRFIYASRPERGLDFLLDQVWPRLRRRYPAAELLVTTYDNPAARIEEPVYEECRRRIRRSEGVREIGPLSRRDFWSRMAECAAVLYPTDYPETSCMVALEAQALGVPIVTTGRYGLVETVACEETLVHEPWRSSAYLERFLETASRLVEDEGFHRRARETGQAHVRRETHSWDALARQWTGWFHGLFADRFSTGKRGILRTLLSVSDLLAARHLVDTDPCPESTFDPQDLADLRRRMEDALPDPGTGGLRPPPEPGRNADLELQIGQSLDRVLSGGTRLLDVGGHAGPLLRPCLLDRPALDLIRTEGGDRGPRGDVAVLGEVLHCAADPVALLEQAERLATRGVLGILRRGPWQGTDHHVRHFTDRDLRNLLAGKKGAHLHAVEGGRSARGEELGWWVFSYFADPANAAGRLDPDTKIVRTPPRPKISATLLVKNEEAHLRACVESLADVVEEILVGDTGSTDSTTAIAESMGFEWNAGPESRRRLLRVEFRDFAQARNDLARHATGDYILWLDADEILVNAQNLRGWVDSTRYFEAYALEQRQASVDLQIQTERPIRCFKRRTSRGPLQWFGCIHEVVEHEINHGPERVLCISDAYLAHVGYLHDEVRRKKSFGRNFPLLIKDRLENPGRRLGYILGMREYLNLAQAELSSSGGAMTLNAYDFLNHGHQIWEEHIRHFDEPFRNVAFGISREILGILAHHRLPLRSTGRVPFRAGISMDVECLGKGGSRSEASTFFSSMEELREALDDRLAGVERRLGLSAPVPLEEIGIHRSPAPVDLDLPPALFGLTGPDNGDSDVQGRGETLF